MDRWGGWAGDVTDHLDDATTTTDGGHEEVSVSLRLTATEMDALEEIVRFDACTSANAGGHPASHSLLLKIENAYAGIREGLVEDAGAG